MGARLAGRPGWTNRLQEEVEQRVADQKLDRIRLGGSDRLADKFVK